MKNLKKTLALVLSVIMIFGCMTVGMMASATEYEGNYAYEVYDGEATIVYVNAPEMKGKVVIPSELGGYPVVAIDDYAFEGCLLATEFVVPDTVKYIYSNAFYGCDSVTKFDIGDGIDYLPYGLLDDLDNLEELVLGKKVRITAEDAWFFFDTFECYETLNISVSEDNRWLDVVDGVLYGEDMTLLLYYPISSAATVYEMPETVECVFAPLFLAKNIQKIAFNDKFSFMDDYENDYEMLECLEDLSYDAIMLAQMISIVIPPNIAEISVDPAHPYLATEENALYNKDKTLLIKYAPNRADTAFTLNEDLVFISTEALSGARNLELTISDGFTENLNDFIEDEMGSDEIDVSYAMEVFLSSSAAKSFIVADTNKYLKADNGVLYNKSMTDLVKYPIDSYGNYYELPATVGIENMIDEDNYRTGAFASLKDYTLMIDPEYITASDLTVHVSEDTLDFALDAVDNEEDIYEVIATAFIGVKEICFDEKVFDFKAYNAMIEDLIETVEEAEEEMESYQEMLDAFKSLVAVLEDESVDAKSALINYIDTATDFGIIDEEDLEDIFAELDAMTEEEMEETRVLVASFIKEEINDIEDTLDDPYMDMQLDFMKGLCVKAGLCKGEALYEIVWRNAPVSIKTPSTAEIKHGETLILRAEYDKIPEGAKLVWSVSGSGVEIEPSEDGKSCAVKSVGKGDATVKLTVFDASGKVVKDENGDDLGSEIEIKSNSNLWLRIVAFFKKLFKMNTTIEKIYTMK